MIRSLITVYRANYHQGQPTHDRRSYQYVRQQIRELRRHSPRHMDVLWYQTSLGIEPYLVEVTRRTTYSWSEKCWVDLGRGRMPTRSETGLNVGIIGPVGRLP